MYYYNNKYYYYNYNNLTFSVIDSRYTCTSQNRNIYRGKSYD